MRRKDREVTDATRVDAIIQACDCARIGFVQESGAYIVPLNFAYLRDGDTPTFYFHGAKVGRKIDLIAQCPNVGFELDTDHAVHAGDAGCDYSFRFQSVIGTGKVSLVADMAEKKDALRRIVWHYSGKDAWDFTDAQADAVAVIKLTVSEMACKEHL